MSGRDAGHGSDDPSYEYSSPICEAARDILMGYESIPQSNHLPRGPTPYFASSDIDKFLQETDSQAQGEDSLAKKVFFCNCAKCRRQAGLPGGLDNRNIRWDQGQLLGEFATLYALLIYLRCPGLVNIFRQHRISLGPMYLESGHLACLDKCKALDPRQRKNIRTEILRTQYQFHVRKLGKSSDIAFIDEREILPITEDENAAGEGAFGEVYPFDVRPEYVDESLKYLPTNRFARKIFKRPTETEFVKEFVLQQLKSERFQHDHLMPALAAFQHGGDYFILFEFAQTTLYKLLGSDESIYNTQELWNQVRGLASGMAHLHKESAEGIGQNSGRMLHRDLKPANILIVNRVMKIADFGFASYDIPTTTYSRPTNASVHEGINHYSSPPCDEVCDKDDVYSLGAIFSEIACFDIGKGPKVLQYRQSRFDEVAEGQSYHSRRFYNPKTNAVKKSVIDQHSSLLDAMREKSDSLDTNGDPWQEFFFQRPLFDMIESMLHENKSTRPRAESVEDTLRKFAEQAEVDVAQNPTDRMQHHVVNKWLQTLVASPPGPATLENRFIACFDTSHKCGLWLYPTSDNARIEVSRFHYDFELSILRLVREREEIVDRKQKYSQGGVKPLYLDSTKANTLVLINQEKHTVYTFSRLSDTLRFQGIMTGQQVCKYMSLELIGFCLKNYSTPSPISLFRRKDKKSKDKSKDKDLDITEHGGHLQIWTRERPQGHRDGWIVILAVEALNVIKIANNFVKDGQGLRNLASPQPLNMVRLALAQTYSVNSHNGIPFEFDPGKYENHDEVRVTFKDAKDTQSFWRILTEVQTKLFSESPPSSIATPPTEMAKSQRNLVMFRRDTETSQKTGRSRESAGSQRDKTEDRGDRVTPLPLGHHLSI